MNALAESTGPLQFSLEGEPVRRAAAVFERERVRLATALRRALPFLTRRDVPVAMEWARAAPAAELMLDLPRPVHVVHLAVEPGGAPGALVFDAGALSRMLDGVLGGDGRALPTLNPSGLTAPQNALVSRTVEGVVRAVAEVLAARAGVRVEPIPARPDADNEGGEGTPIACSFALGAPPDVGRVVLVLPKGALVSTGGAGTPKAADPRVANALSDVDLELVVELARQPIKLGAVLALKVGDTLPLDVSVGGAVCVRADDRTLFMARPTAAGGRIAVRIVSGTNVEVIPPRATPREETRQPL